VFFKIAAIVAGAGCRRFDPVTAHHSGLWRSPMLTAATIAVALFAALIAFGQWWTARQKLVLDLFEKRFAVFMELRTLVSEAVQLGKFSKPGSINKVLARSQFLFGGDVNERLRELHRLFTELEMGQPSAAPQEILEKFEKMTPIFYPYLAMQQKVPELGVLK
jgi:hypothetical protein